MLNFRYHVVSLVAVFLALLIGMLVGVGALDRTTVDFLQNRLDAVEANANERALENELLVAQVDRLNRATLATNAFAVTNRLTDVPTIVVAVRGVDAVVVTGTVELARRAGADAPGILWLEERWVLAEDGDLASLAEAAGVEPGSKAETRARAFAVLATRLVSGPAATADALRNLAEAGFVTFENVGGAGSDGLNQLGGLGTSVVALLGTDGVLTAKQSLLPLARGAVTAGLPLAAAEHYRQVEDGLDRASFVGVVRSDPDLTEAISTVDDLEEPSGPTVTLLALSDLGRNVVGHYGFGEGATAVAPTWWQP